LATFGTSRRCKHEFKVNVNSKDQTEREREREREIQTQTQTVSSSRNRQEDRQRTPMAIHFRSHLFAVSLQFTSGLLSCSRSSTVQTIRLLFSLGRRRHFVLFDFCTTKGSTFVLPHHHLSDCSSCTSHVITSMIRSFSVSIVPCSISNGKRCL
jgi:hypothetical protein